jgi:hypothetical protein
MSEVQLVLVAIGFAHIYIGLVGHTECRCCERPQIEEQRRPVDTDQHDDKLM